MVKHPRSKDDIVPVPEDISIALCLLDEGLSEHQWKAEAKREIRKCFHEQSRFTFDEEPLFQEYDARIWALIREVMEEN